MAAKDRTEAQKEGKDFARLLGSLVVKQTTPDFEAVTDFASYMAQSVIGYTDADRANGWAKGFMAKWLEAPKAVGPHTATGLEQINTMRAWLGMEPLDSSASLLTDGKE